jgi:hypothetical protein
MLIQNCTGCSRLRQQLEANNPEQHITTFSHVIESSSGNPQTRPETLKHKTLAISRQPAADKMAMGAFQDRTVQQNEYGCHSWRAQSAAARREPY